LILTNVQWLRDHQHRLMLQFDIDGHPAHILSEQKRELTRRGIVKGIDFLASEWREQAHLGYIHGDLEPGLAMTDLRGCTDNHQIVGLYDEMCRAILAGTWQPGPRPLPL